MNARTLPRSVLVIEGETLARQMVVACMLRHGFTVFQVADPSAAKDCLCGIKPDIILVNWIFAGMGALPLIRSLRASLAHHHTPVIGIAQDAGENEVIDALESGADDFLIRPFSPAMLMARTMAVLRRRAPEISDRELTIDALTLSPTRHEVTCVVGDREVRVDISPTEFRMLYFFMSKPEVAHTRQEIRNRVWSGDQTVDERTVDAHIKRLRTALSPSGMDFMIQTVRSVGYRLSSNPLVSDSSEASPLPASSVQRTKAVSRREPAFASR